MTVITSRHHPIVKEFRELARGGGPMMLLDGWHLLSEAVNAGVSVETVAICGPRTDGEELIIDRARRGNAQVVEVSGPVLNALSPVSSPTGVVAAAHKPIVDASSLLTPAPALVLAAIGIQDPGNAGAVIRSAAASGSTGIVLDGTSADPWGWKALRASMGGVFHLPVLRARSLAPIMDQWTRAGVSILAAVPRGGRPMYDVVLSRPTAILLGGEGQGLPEHAVAAAEMRISIPMNGAIESLNVAVAAALLLYEAKRQRTR